MTVDLAKDVVAWLNTFPSKTSLLPYIGMRTLITGVQFDYRLHCRVEFGQYCQVHKDKDRKNRVEVDRTTGAIALRHSGNKQGGYRFLNLNTGRVVVRQHFTVVLVTQEVIKRVEHLGNLDNKYRETLLEDEQNLEDEIRTEDDDEIHKEQGDFQEEQALNWMKKQTRMRTH